MRASHWLAVTFHVLPLPADTAIARTEELLQEADGDAWAEADLLKPLSILYAYVGRAADARAAVARTRGIFARFGAEFRPGRKRDPGRLDRTDPRRPAGGGALPAGSVCGTAGHGRAAIPR
jgi:hypothetical protein